MNKPIIRFYEPFEIVVLVNNEIRSYLDEPQITENQILEKYNIDYDSFYKSDIRNEKGLPENIKSKSDIHKILLNYINIVNE
jgi:hypothetical protein